MKARFALAMFAGFMAVYVGSYACLSVELGRYGPEWQGSIWEAPKYGWQLRGLRHDNAWYQERNWALVTFYLPVVFLDRALWHPALDKAPPK